MTRRCQRAAGRIIRTSIGVKIPPRRTAGVPGHRLRASEGESRTEDDRLRHHGFWPTSSATTPSGQGPGRWRRRPLGTVGRCATRSSPPPPVGRFDSSRAFSPAGSAVSSPRTSIGSSIWSNQSTQRDLTRPQPVVLSRDFLSRSSQPAADRPTGAHGDPSSTQATRFGRTRQLTESTWQATSGDRWCTAGPVLRRATAPNGLRGRPPYGSPRLAPLHVA